MAKKKKQLIVFTKGKAFRLLFFILFTAGGFFLSRYNAEYSTFGWGYAFGLVAMVSLTG
ncbi:MAG: hypothetical protein WDA18_07955 [Candidatus Ratteibacteria bacterium]|jgi:hypothetical protein